MKISSRIGKAASTTTTFTFFPPALHGSSFNPSLPLKTRPKNHRSVATTFTPTPPVAAAQPSGAHPIHLRLRLRLPPPPPRTLPLLRFRIFKPSYAHTGPRQRRRGQATSSARKIEGKFESLQADQSITQLNNLPSSEHIVQGGLTSLTVVTMKTVCSMMSLRFWPHKNHKISLTTCSR